MPVLGSRAVAVVSVVRRHPHWALAMLVGVLAVPYAVLGVGWVLDDWFALRNAHFSGAWLAAGKAQWLARPGQAAVYGLTFGLIGPHPLALYAIQVALAAVTAVLLFRLLRPFLGDGRALGAAALWAVLPNHASLVNWPSAVGISVALVLLLTGCLLVVDPRPLVTKEVGAALLLTVSVLCYEAVGPAALAAALLLPRLLGQGWRWRQTALCWGGLALAGAWMATHVHPAKQTVRATADLTQLLPAHFGWGVAPRVLAPVVSLIALAGLAAVLARTLGIGRRRLTGTPFGQGAGSDRLVLAGVVVILLGTAPFVRYHYAPLGAGDRANVVAGVGTAVAWLGLAGIVWELRRWLAASISAAVVAAMVAGGIEGVLAWHGAARSARHVLAALPVPVDGAMVVVGPDPLVVRNVAGFLDRSNIEPAAQLRFGDRSAQARMSFSVRDFESVPPAQRLDLRCVAGTVESTRWACPPRQTTTRPNDPLKRLRRPADNSRHESNQ